MGAWKGMANRTSFQGGEMRFFSITARHSTPMISLSFMILETLRKSIRTEAWNFGPPPPGVVLGCHMLPMLAMVWLVAMCTMLSALISPPTMRKKAFSAAAFPISFLSNPTSSSCSVESAAKESMANRPGPLIFPLAERSS